MSSRFANLSEHSDTPGRYAPADDMRIVVVVDGYRVRYVQIRDGVALSQTVLHDAMSAANWDRRAYNVTGGNGWVTAISGGRNVMSAHIVHSADPDGYPLTAPAYGIGG